MSSDSAPGCLLRVDPGAVRTLAAVLGRSAPDEGDPLPPLWHWAALKRWMPTGELGPDGHPADPGVALPTGFARRMFAGGEVRWHRPIRVGDEVTVTETAGPVEVKQGRSGSFARVSWQIEISAADGQRAITERQDIVYRPSVRTVEQTAVAPDASAPSGAGLRLVAGRWSLFTDPALLVRFSSATANAHRIHYDWPYATSVEGYRGLVVHGPLLVLSMAEVAARELPRRPPRLLRHRGLAPLFCGDPASVELASDGPDGAHATVLGPDGGTRAVAEIEFETRVSSRKDGGIHA